MRFLLGLIFGASLTLLTVTTYTGEFPVDLKQRSVGDAQHALQTWLKERRGVAHKPTPATTKPVPTVVEHPPQAQPVPARVAERTAIQHETVTPQVVPRPEEVTSPTPMPPTTVAGGRQAVWTPFHSEASAKGFAGRLSSAIGHQFHVERLAAKTYVVTFDYRNERERVTLESRVHAVTGTDAS